MHKNVLLILAIGAIASIMIVGVTYDSMIYAKKDTSLRTECKFILHHHTAVHISTNPPFQTCA